MSQTELYRRAFWASWALLAVVTASSIALGPASALSTFEIVIVVVYAVVLVLAQFVALRERQALAAVRVATGLAVGILALLMAFGSASFAPMAAYFAIPVAIAAAALGRRATWIVLAIATLCATVLPLLREEISVALLGTALIHVSVYWLVAFLAARTFMVTALSEPVDVVDPRTGLIDYHTFARRGGHAHERAVKEPAGYAIVMIDIDNLKGINDAHGHAAGDDVVIMMADVIRRLTSSADILARFSGDKFVAMLWAVSADEARALAQRIRNAVHGRTLESAGALIRVKANVGIADFPASGRSLQQVVSRAETDMYEDRKGRAKPQKQPVFRRRSGGSG